MKGPKTVGEHIAILQQELKRELGRRGYFVGQHFDRIWSAKLEPLPINMRFESEGMALIVRWACNGHQHKYNNPSPRGLADFLIKNLGEDPQPPPAINSKQTQPKRQTGARVASTVPISVHEYQEYQDLKKRASNGVWVSRELFQQIKYGFIPPDQQKEILRMFDRIDRRLSV